MGAGSTSHILKLGGSHARCEEGCEKEGRCQEKGSGEEGRRQEKEEVNRHCPDPKARRPRRWAFFIFRDKSGAPPVVPRISDATPATHGCAL